MVAHAGEKQDPPSVMTNWGLVKMKPLLIYHLSEGIPAQKRQNGWCVGVR